MHSQSVGKSPQDHGCWFGWVFGFGFFWIVFWLFFLGLVFFFGGCSCCFFSLVGFSVCFAFLKCWLVRLCWLRFALFRREGEVPIQSKAPPTLMHSLAVHRMGPYLWLHVGSNLGPLVRIPIERLHAHEQISRVWHVKRTGRTWKGKSEAPESQKGKRSTPWLSAKRKEQHAKQPQKQNTQSG